MSDVSGIPYMGPMGQGNFFAPSFSYNPQMSAGQISSTYMPEIANNQNVVNNLFNTGGGMGGFGRATDYYSQLGANYLAAVPSSWNNPYTHGASVPQSLRVEGGLYGDSSTFNQGAMQNFALGGGGYNFPSIPDYSGGPGGGGGGINWNTIFQSAGGGLGGSPRLGLDDVQTWAGNWNVPQSSAFDRSGGGGTRDPFPNMAMPGGLNSPMTVPQQQPLDYGSLFGRGVGGATAEPYPTTSPSGGLDAPMTGAPSSSLDWSTLFSGGADTGMSMPGGLNSPMTVPEQQAPAYDYGSMFGKGTGGAAQPAPDGTRTYDFAPMYEAGGGGGFGSGGGDTAGLFGATAPSLGGDAFSYNKDPMWQDTTPDALAAQARARLAGIMGSGDTEPLEPGVSPREAAVPELPAELPTGSDVPLPRERPAGADAPRPPETVPAAAPPVEPPAPLPKGAARPPASVPFTVEPGKEAGVRAVQPRLAAAVQGGAQFLPPGYSVEVFSGARNGPGQAYHAGGRAMDVRIIGPDGAIPSEGADNTGMYTLLARGVKTWAAQNDPQLTDQLGWGGAFGTQRGSSGGANVIPDLMHFDLGGSRGALRPEVQFGRLTPLSEAEKNAMPAYIPWLGANQVPLDAAPASGRRSDLGTSDATDFSAQARSGAPDRGMDPSYWADVLSNDAGAASNVVGPTSSAFDFNPGVFGEGGYGNVFAPQTPETGPGLDSPIWNAGRDRLISGATETTNLPANLAAQQAMGDPFNPGNYNTLDQASDLAAVRSPFAQELLSRPDLMEKAKAVSAAEIGPDLNRRTDADIAGFFETMLNNMATGARAENFPTLESYLSKKGYYQPIRRDEPGMAAGYQALKDNPELSARLDRIMQQVFGGSNVSDLSTQNSVKIPGFPQGGEGALLPEWGGTMGQFVSGPNEYYTSMLNPYNDPRATSYIGAGAQQKYRDFYQSLMPPGQMPWETR